LGYLGKQVEDHFGSGSRLGVQVAYSCEASPLGTGGALKNAEAQLDAEFLMTNGDTYLDIDYRALVAGYREHPCLGLMVAFDNRGGEMTSNLAIEKDGAVAAYRKRDARGLTHVDAGAIVLNKHVLDLAPAGAVFSLEEEIYPRMIEQKQLHAWVTGERFIDMGSREGMAALEARLP
ncbi:MAG: hypothetical protein L0099_01200, partial [Acidobacteria bacterium]|nr:hypothetical protein [Acidobacteriota bacterium]